MKRLSRLFILTLILAGPRVFAAEDAEAQYIQVFDKITDADLLFQGSRTNLATNKYLETQKGLLNLQRANPNWNPKVVAYRLDYISNQLAVLNPPVTNAPAASDQAPVATEGTPAPAPAHKAENKAGVSKADIQVKLLDAGAEPRQVLRLHPKAGDTQSVTLTMKMAMAMEMPGAPAQPMKMPAMVLPLNVTVQSVAENGDIAYQSVVGDPDVVAEEGAMPQMVSAMKTSLASIKGTTSSGVISSRGFNHGTEVKLPAGVNPQMKQSMDQMKDAMSSVSAPLPEEPVGVGAKWEVKMPLKANGMTMQQTMNYQVISIEGDHLNATASITQTAANQKIQSPAMPNMQVNLTHLNGTNTGTLSYDFGKIMPTQAKIGGHTEMAMGMNVGGKQQTMNMKIDMDMQMDSK